MTEQQKVYVVHLSITELVRGTNQSSKGNALTGLWVRGTVPKDGQIEDWEKFLMDWNAGEPIAAIEQAGVGAQVDIRMLKEGRFWNIQSVTNMGQAVPAPSTQYQTSAPQQEQTQMFQPETADPAPAEVPQEQEETYTVRDCRVIAMNKSVDLTIGMMANGILKGTKVTPQIVYEGVIVLADRVADYLVNGGAADPVSDTSPLQREPGCDDGDCTGTDDIPF